MESIMIDGVQYEYDSLSDNAKAQAASLRFLEVHMKRLQDDIAVVNTARSAYVESLRAELAKL